MLQVWDDTGASLLFVWKLPKNEMPSMQHADFVRGICFTVTDAGGVQLCAGCSNGSIQVCGPQHIMLCSTEQSISVAFATRAVAPMQPDAAL